RIAEELTGEMKKEGGGLSAIETLSNQCLNREADWKEYYKKRMAELESEVSIKQQLEREVLERDAEILFKQGNYKKAADAMEKLIGDAVDSAERGWYMQIMAN